MKKTLATVIISAILILHSSLGWTKEELTLIRGGSDTGTTSQRSDLYTTALENMGYKVNRVPSMPNNKLIKVFESMTDPVIWPITTDYGSTVTLDFTAEQIVAIEYTGEMYICHVGERTNPSEAKIGVPKSIPMNWVRDQLGYKTLVPYKNNGATRNAALAGEVDAVMINQKSANNLKSAGLSCGVVEGITQTAFLLGKNFKDMDQFRKDVALAYKGKEFSDWQTKAGVTNHLFTGDTDKDYQTARKGFDVWAD
jgi:hypothetical protein